MAERELTDEERFAILRECGIEPNPVIEHVKRDVDRTLIDANLSRSVTERFETLMSLQLFMIEVQRAMKARNR